MRQALEPDSGAPAKARRATEAFLDQASFRPSLNRRERYRVLLVVSELVTNAVQHGAPPIELMLTLDGHCLEVAVRDSGPLPDLTPRSTFASPSTLGGRGLMIVEEIADHWGARVNDSSKTIWCDLDIGSGKTGSGKLLEA